MNEDYKKGIEHGVDGLDKTHFEDYLSSEVSLEWLEDAKAQLVDQQEELEKKIQDTTSKKLQILEAIHEVKPQHDSKKLEVSHLQEQIEDFQQRIVEAKNEKSKNPLHYPLLAGIIYFFAGVVFLFGDLIISHEIVAYALNIKNDKEAWAFACGLAGVTFLLKPAYERLIEEPYLKNPTEKTQKLHRFFQGTLVLISVITLAVLGFFRYEAYKAEKLKDSINREIKSLQLASTPLIQGAEVNEDPSILLKIEEKMKEIDAYNKELVTSPWALASFVLSGVLFAIAGAICFGIAFPILSSYWKRWFWHNPSINRSRRRIKKLRKQMVQIETPRFEYAATLEHYQKGLELLPDLDTLKSEAQKINEQILSITEKIRLARESARISSYATGYDYGEKQGKDLGNDDRKRLKNALEDPSKSFRGNGLRPYQALRKAIGDHLRDN